MYIYRQGSPYPNLSFTPTGQMAIAPTTRTTTIPGIAFIPRWLNHPTFGIAGGGTYDGFGLLGFEHDGAPGFYYAPLNLPDGAVVTSMCIDATDLKAATGDDIVATIGRTSLVTGTPEVMGQTFTSGASPGVQHPCIVPVSNPTIQNSSYVYWLDARMNTPESGFGSSYHRLIAARVTYTVTTPLP
jgi:hypothetical protein